MWVFGGSPVITAECLPLLPRCRRILRTGTGADNVPLDAATPPASSSRRPGSGRTRWPSMRSIDARRPAAGRQPGPPGARRNVGTGTGPGRREPARARRRAGRLRAIAEDIGPAGSPGSSLERRLRPVRGDEDFAEHGVTAGLAGVLCTGQVVSLHCPFTTGDAPSDRRGGTADDARDAILVNTARGGSSTSRSLRALAEGWISGAGLDVLESEPLDPDSPLLRLDNVIITPHIAALSDTFFAESWRLSVETLVDLAGGRWPRASANPGVVPRRPLSRAGEPTRDEQTDNHRHPPAGGVPSPSKGQADDRTVGSPQETVDSDRPMLGGWCAIPSAISAEVLGVVGFDWVVIDAQHGLSTITTCPS